MAFREDGRYPQISNDAGCESAKTNPLRASRAVVLSASRGTSRGTLVDRESAKTNPLLSNQLRSKLPNEAKVMSKDAGFPARLVACAAPSPACHNCRTG